MDGFYLSCCALDDGEKQTVVWFNHSTKEPDAGGIEIIQHAVDNADVIVGHNLKHDLNILRYYGVNFEGKRLHCTMVTEYLLTGQDTRNKSYGLSAVAKTYGMRPKLDEVAQMWAQGIETSAVPSDMLQKYVLDDTKKAYLIFQEQIKRTAELGMERLVQLQNEFIFTLSDIEMNGFLWDKDRAASIIADYEKRVQSADDAFRELVGEPLLNINSTLQLSAALFGGETSVFWNEWVVVEYKTKPYSDYKERTLSEMKKLEGLGFIPEKGTETSRKGVYSTDKATITRLKCKTDAQKRAKELLLQRSVEAKVLETIRGATPGKGLRSKVQPDGYIHPNLNQTVTATGRLSSSDPNSQNLPRGNTSPIKECIIPRYDGIGQFDLSQIEWRAAAYLSQDPVMIFEVNNGVDQHIAACTDIMELPFINKKDKESKQNRTHAKVLNFRMIYGGSAYGYYMDQNMPNFSQKKWRDIVAAFFKKYEGLKRWHQAAVKWVTEGNKVKLPTGRWFSLNKIIDRRGELVWNERQIKNYPVQGISGGDILPLFAVILRRGMLKAGLKSKLILTVHDSIVFDYVKAELRTLMKLCFKIIEQLPKYMTNYFKLIQPWNVRLEGEFEIGPNYCTMEEVTL
jgi:DNA polymerase-1